MSRGGQTMPSQAPLCFDPGSPASDRTEGKKKGRPKAENQALRDIPVSSLRAGWGSCWGLPVKAIALPLLATHMSSTTPSAHISGPATLCLGIRGVAWGPVDHVRGPLASTLTAQGGLDLAAVPRSKGSCSLPALQARAGAESGARVGKGRGG